jgi:hypothetical protein
VHVRVDLHLPELDRAHGRGAAGDLAHPIEIVLDVPVPVGADVVPDLGARRDDLRLAASVRHDVVDARIPLDVLPHVVHGTFMSSTASRAFPSLVRRDGGVGGKPGEAELHGHVGLAIAVPALVTSFAYQ